MYNSEIESDAESLWISCGWILNAFILSIEVHYIEQEVQAFTLEWVHLEFNKGAFGIQPSTRLCKS